MKSAVMGDTWYHMGRIGDGRRTDQVNSVSLTVHVNNTSERIWNTISSPGLFYSAPVCMGESLLAVGGRETQSHEAVSTILRFHYTADSDGQWTEVGQLPMPSYDSICTMTSMLVFRILHIHILIHSTIVACRCMYECTSRLHTVTVK